MTRIGLGTKNLIRTTLLIIIRNLSWVANQHIIMISEGCIFRSNDAENSASITGINYILNYFQIEKYGKCHLARNTLTPPSRGTVHWVMLQHCHRIAVLHYPGGQEVVGGGGGWILRVCVLELKRDCVYKCIESVREWGYPPSLPVVNSVCVTNSTLKKLFPDAYRSARFNTGNINCICWYISSLHKKISLSLVLK